MPSVLFVCTGNICRSPTAEAVFRHHVSKAGLTRQILIDSAGTTGWHEGDFPDSRARATALARGIDMDNIIARKLRKQDYTRFDWLIGMDEGHVAHLQARLGEDSGARLALLMDFVDGPQKGAEVPDPYFGHDDGFNGVFDMIDAGARGLLARIRQEQGF